MTGVQTCALPIYIHQGPQREERNRDESPSGDHSRRNQSLSKCCSSMFHVSTSSWGTTVSDAGSGSGASKYPIQIETQTRKVPVARKFKKSAPTLLVNSARRA